MSHGRRPATLAVPITHHPLPITPHRTDFYRDMNLKKLPIAHLHPAPYNPRLPLEPGTPGYKRLERSLREFDLVQPVVWNERTGHIVAGHQRLEILKTHGETEVDAVVVDLPLEREKALNVALNNAQVGSDWDAEKLTAVLAELRDCDGVDVSLTGFDADELNDLILAPADPPGAGAAGFAGDDNEDGEPMVRVTLEIPPDDWETVRPDLDDVVAYHDLVSHVRLPSRE